MGKSTAADNQLFTIKPDYDIPNNQIYQIYWENLLSVVVSLGIPYSAYYCLTIITSFLRTTRVLSKPYWI